MFLQPRSIIYLVELFYVRNDFAQRKIWTSFSTIQVDNRNSGQQYLDRSTKKLCSFFKNMLRDRCLPANAN